MPLTPPTTPIWYTAKMAAEYLNTNAKTIRRLWAQGFMRFVKPPIGVTQTRKEWMDEYMEKCEIRLDPAVDNKIDSFLQEVLNA